MGTVARTLCVTHRILALMIDTAAPTTKLSCFHPPPPFPRHIQDDKEGGTEMRTIRGGVSSRDPGDSPPPVGDGPVGSSRMSGYVEEDSGDFGRRHDASPESRSSITSPEPYLSGHDDRQRAELLPDKELRQPKDEDNVMDQEDSAPLSLYGAPATQADLEAASLADTAADTARRRDIVPFEVEPHVLAQFEHRDYLDLDFVHLEENTVSNAEKNAIALRLLADPEDQRIPWSFPEAMLTELDSLIFRPNSSWKVSARRPWRQTVTSHRRVPPICFPSAFPSCSKPPFFSIIRPPHPITPPPQPSQGARQPPRAAVHLHAGQHQGGKAARLPIQRLVPAVSVLLAGRVLGEAA